MAKLYADRDEINLHPIGSFYDPKDFVAPEHKKEYVTMINPAGHKGVAIFAKLAQVCQKEMPEVKFLTVNMREHFKDALTKLHEKNDPHRFPYTLQDFPNVFMLDPQKDMRLVYAVTSVLVVPSLWFEAWGRVATEAIYNNIPVMCSKSGGLTEACAGGGLSLDVPEHCKRDYGSLPTDEEIKPWVQGLKDLLNHKYDQKVEAARQELVKLNAPDRLIEAITPLIQQTQRNRKQHPRDGRRAEQLAHRGLGGVAVDNKEDARGNQRAQGGRDGRDRSGKGGGIPLVLHGGNGNAADGGHSGHARAGDGGENGRGHYRHNAQAPLLLADHGIAEF